MVPGPLRLSPQIKGGEAEWCPHFRFLGTAKMMSFLFLLLVGILFPATQAKQFTKCELSQVLKDMDGYGGITLPECEFSAALLCTILHLVLSFTLFYLLFLFLLSLNYLIILISSPLISLLF